MLNFTGGNLYSEGQIATNVPQGAQSLPTSAPSSPSSPSLSVPLGVKITSHTTGQQVSTGQLTISGTSTDTPNANCEVYTDVNDLKPMQKVAARGPGGSSDYSAWTYTYTSAYSLIKNGTNNLTSKISCIDSPTTGNLTKWNSVNLTGVDGLVLQQQPPSIISAVGNSINNTGLLISQSAAISTFEPTVGTATPAFESDNDNSDNDNSEESNEEENNDHDEQDNEEAEVETVTSDDEDDSEEEDNDVDLFSSENVGDETNDESATITTDANDENNGENNGNPSNSEGNNDENNTDESRSASNEDNNAAESVPTNEEPEDEAAESETNEDTEDEDECNIGDRGFPFCDDRLGEELFDDEDDDDDDCDIGDRGFPFCDGKID
jgi:hypothetical protein